MAQIFDFDAYRANLTRQEPNADQRERREEWARFNRRMDKCEALVWSLAPPEAIARFRQKIPAEDPVDAARRGIVERVEQRHALVHRREKFLTMCRAVMREIEDVRKNREAT